MRQWITITSKLDTGSGFAVTEDGDEVFVPALHGRELVAGDEVDAILARQDGKAVPWKVGAILPDDDDAEEPEFAVTRKLIDDVTAAILADLRPVIASAVKAALEEQQ